MTCKQHLTFFRVRPRKSDKPTRCCMADNLGFLPLSRIATAEPIMGLSRCFFLWFLEIVGGTAMVLRIL